MINTNTAEQITKGIENRKIRIEWKQKELADLMRILQECVSRGADDFEYDLAFHLHDKAIKIQNLKQEIREEMNAITILKGLL